MWSFLLSRGLTICNQFSQKGTHKHLDGSWKDEQTQIAYCQGNWDQTADISQLSCSSQTLTLRWLAGGAIGDPFFPSCSFCTLYPGVMLVQTKVQAQLHPSAVPHCHHNNGNFSTDLKVSSQASPQAPREGEKTSLGDHEDFCLQKSNGLLYYCMRIMQKSQTTNFVPPTGFSSA